jgi:hypothetical protein
LKRGLPFQARAARPEVLEPLAREWSERGGGELAVRIAVQVTDERAETGAVSSVAQANALVGPATYLAEQLVAYQDLGVTDVSLIPGHDDETSLRTIDALAAQILPALGR